MPRPPPPPKTAKRPAPLYPASLAATTVIATLAASALHTAAAQNAGAGSALGSSGAVLPVLGTDVRVGDVRPQLESYFQGGAPLSVRPKYIITPAIDAQLGATDNADPYSLRRHGDIFTVITPQVVVSGDTARLKTNISYSPSITEYASTPDQNRIAQYFNGTATGIVVPDLFFIDMSGAITQQSLTTGGFNQGQTNQTVDNRNDVQTITVSINPYVQRRFGGYGNGRLDYIFSRTLQDLDSGNTNVQNAFNNQSYGSVGNLSTSTIRGYLGSGENFGRYNDQLSAQATQYAGAGSYHGAYRNEVSDQLAYAIDHTVTVFGSFGYQQLHYDNGYNVNGPTYSVGARYAPNPDTSITVEYGRHDGDDNISFQGQVALTSRLRLVAQYSTGITSDLEQSQTNLAASTTNSSGALVSNANGAPVLNTTGFSGLQNGIYRLKRLSASLLFLKDRDSYTLSVNNDNRTSLSNATTIIGNAVVPAGTNTTDTYASFSWQHELSADISSNVNVQYGVTSNGSGAVQAFGTNQTSISASAALTRRFTETLSGSVRYTYTQQTGGQVVTGTGVGSGTYSADTLLVSLHKSF